jgi:hypothetical protein
MIAPLVHRNITIDLVAVLFCLLLVNCDDHWTSPLSPADKSYVEHLERAVELDGVASLDARTVNGYVEVNGAARTSGLVRIRKEIRAHSVGEARRFASKVQILVERDGSEIRVYSEYPEPPQHIQVSVSFNIESSRTANLTLRSVNGGIRILGVAAEVDAETINGSITAKIDELRGRGRFATSNGRTDVLVSEGTAPLAIDSTNGSVVVRLHTGFSGRLDAQTVNGRVRAACRITRTYGPGPNRIVGVLGQGGTTPVILRTVNGNIDLTTVGRPPGLQAL